MFAKNQNFKIPALRGSGKENYTNILTCIFTAMITEFNSGPRGLLRTNRVKVRLHNLKSRYETKVN